MLDDLERLLIRREGFGLPRLAAPGGGAPAFLGKVTSTGTAIAAGKFLLVNPVEVTGSETEGGAGTFAVQVVSVPVYLVGPTLPATGDYLVCRRVDHRWVADRGPASDGYPTTPVVNIPGCLCQGTPATLSLVVTFPPGEDTHTYANAWQSCTLGYYTSAPGYMPSSAFMGAGYYSTTTWIDDFGFTVYFRLGCFSSQYSLGLGRHVVTEFEDTWQAPGLVYTWSMGGLDSVNTCSYPDPDGAGALIGSSDPFALCLGHTASGVVFNGKVKVNCPDPDLAIAEPADFDLLHPGPEVA